MKTADTETIPLLRDKTRAVLKDAQVRAGSHAGRVLKQTLEQFPRDMMFQIEPAVLLSMASGIVNLINPTFAVVMGGLALGRVPYERWLGFMWPLLLVLMIIIMGALSLAAAF